MNKSYQEIMTQKTWTEECYQTLFYLSGVFRNITKNNLKIETWDNHVYFYIKPEDGDEIYRIDMSKCEIEKNNFIIGEEYHIDCSITYDRVEFSGEWVTKCQLAFDSNQYHDLFGDGYIRGEKVPPRHLTAGWVITNFIDLPFDEMVEGFLEELDMVRYIEAENALAHLLAIVDMVLREDRWGTYKVDMVDNPTENQLEFNIGGYGVLYIPKDLNHGNFGFQSTGDNPNITSIKHLKYLPTTANKLRLMKAIVDLSSEDMKTIDYKKLYYLFN